MSDMKRVSSSWDKLRILDLEERYEELLKKNNCSNISVEKAVEGLVRTFEGALRSYEEKRQ